MIFPPHGSCAPSPAPLALVTSVCLLPFTATPPPPQVKLCKSVYSMDNVPNTGSYAWGVPADVDDQLPYRVYLRNNVAKTESSSPVFTVTPYLRDVTTRWGCVHMYMQAEVVANCGGRGSLGWWVWWCLVGAG